MSDRAVPPAARHVVFMLYDNRSGSTLLSALLDRYPTIDVTPEIDRVADFLERGAGRERLHRLLEDASPPSREITHQIVKGPRLHFHMAQLSKAFPGCSFLQIVRDGRAVFASKRRTRSPSGRAMDDNLLHAGWNWRRKLEIAAGSGCPVHTVRYEDLVQEPATALDAILDFLGVPTTRRRPDREVGDFFRDKIPASRRYLHTKLTGRVSTDGVDAWRDELAAHEVLLYERKNHRALAEHAYGLVRHGTPQPVALVVRAHLRSVTDVARWGLRLTSTAIRHVPAPRFLLAKIRNKYGEAKVRRSAHAPER